MSWMKDPNYFPIRKEATPQKSETRLIHSDTNKRIYKLSLYLSVVKLLYRIGTMTCVVCIQGMDQYSDPAVQDMQCGRHVCISLWQHCQSRSSYQPRHHKSRYDVLSSLSSAMKHVQIMSSSKVHLTSFGLAGSLSCPFWFPLMMPYWKC